MITFNDWRIPVDSTYLWGILAVVILIFLVASYIFRYHWKFYGIEGNKKIFAASLFLILSVVLIIVATVSILIFEQGI